MAKRFAISDRVLHGISPDMRKNLVMNRMIAAGFDISKPYKEERDNSEYETVFTQDDEPADDSVST